MIDAYKVRSLLDYDAHTGKFIWHSTGREAGCHTANGYLVIGIDGQLYLAHRLAWLWMTGSWSAARHIDHVNRVRDDNRWINLRGATVAKLDAAGLLEFAIERAVECEALRQFAAWQGRQHAEAVGEVFLAHGPSEAERFQNLANSGARSTSKSGVKGVSWCKATRKWRATLTVNGKQRSLGRYVSLDDAANAYQAAAIGLHGAYAA